MLALWSNEDCDISEFDIQAFDIVDDNLVEADYLKISRIYTKYSKLYYDKRIFDTDIDAGLALGFDGKEKTSGKIRLNPKYNDNIVGYMTVETSGFDNPDLHSSLLTAGNYGSNGFYLRNDNYLEKLPMFCASRYITYNRVWTERARIMKSADDSDNFFKDVKNKKLDNYLQKCLLFTCLEMQNHMRTCIGSDGRFYRNELCLDDTNGDTLATTYIKKYEIDNTEKQLIEQWNKVLQSAKATKEYNPELTYGVYQIFCELNITYKDDETERTIYVYPELNGNLQTLKKFVIEYYNKEIVPTLFKYEFL